MKTTLVIDLLLWVAVGAGLAGCEPLGNVYCDVVPNTRYCCERMGTAVWDETTHSCGPLPLIMPSS